MRKRFLTTASVAILLAMTAAGTSFASLCGVAEIAVLGINSAHVSRDAKVLTGDVVANGDGTAATLDEGAEVALDRNAMVVVGDVKGHTLDLDTGATIGGTKTCVEPAALCAPNNDPPPYTDVPAFEPASPSSFDLVVGPGATVTVGDQGVGALNRRDFGNITIDRGGVLVFTGGGDFDANSINEVSTVGGQCPFPCRSIVFAKPTDLRVAGRIDTGAASFVGPQAGSGIAASDIVIYGGGANGGAGGPLSTPFAVNVGKESRVEANIYAPFGTIELDKDSTAKGSFIALDVELQTRTQVELDSAFENEAPTAIAQEVLTDGANPLVITLEGSDPEGFDLGFSIAVPPTAGTLGAISPITPAPVNQCSQSGAACTVDADCPFFAGGETCELVTPPITQATVTYTPTAANCVTEPTSGEVTCPEDFFTFAVTDECGDQGSAIVSINGGTDEAAGDPGPGTAVVEANDQEIDAVVNQVKTITLSAAAPATVASLTFRVETLPTGALQDSNGAAVVAGTDLPSPVLTYQAPATTGADPFTFSARDSTTTTPPCGSPSCDTGTINIDVGNLPELAPDQSAETDLNTPVAVTLRAIAGGTGSGGGQPLVAAESQITKDYNGELTAAQIASARSRQGTGGRPGTRVGSLGPTALTVDGGWSQFGWCDTQTTPDCNLLVDLVNEVEVNQSPFNFSVDQASCLRITDTLAKGDHWRVENLAGGGVDWTDFTSEVPQSTVGTTSDPNVAFGDLSYSHGEFDLSSGSYSIKLTTIPPNSFAFGTAAYIRVDTGPCADIVWTVTSLPANGTLTNLDGSLVQIGDTYFAEPTVVFTPALNFSGSTSFEYQVAQGGTVGAAVLDTALVDILVSANDPCILVGRDPGCAPGGGQILGGGSASGSDPIDFGPRQGLTVAIEGRGGSVTTAPVELPGTRATARLICSGEAECHKGLPAGATVTLYARPDGDHFEFLGWGGHCRGSEPIVTIVLDAATSCTAHFGPRSVDE